MSNPIFRVSAKTPDIGAMLAAQGKGQAAIIREVKRQTKEPVYVFTQRQINQLKEEAKREATADAMKLIIAIPMLTLHWHFGFGDKRLDKFLREASCLVRNIEHGITSVQDVIDDLHDELGITINMDEEENKNA